ncbi:HPr family phosphocarrier protein [Cellulosilyticum sp. I15G10I2]|uniref:HPr family phosphocarrier protein n=1 Tax=Cellulosilyticum sp. I15G10I2 TaxID=1892843 RepID=UPI00085C9953|nr:HPr family phosphocarrier protein [Cellulosilyticum sp. I15G10I2]
MKSITISLNSIEKVKQFVNLINIYDGDFDLSSGRYIIDAKSIMGIFSLDLSKPLRLDIYNDNYADEIISKLNAFIHQ